MFNKDTIKKILGHKSGAHPEYHEVLRQFIGQEEDLSQYRSKQKINNSRIPSMNLAEMQREEEISQLVNTLTNGPCLVQFHHPEDDMGRDNFRLLIDVIRSNETSWEMILTNLRWVSFNFSGPSLVMSFDKNSVNSQEVESHLKSICLRSSTLVSFKMANENDQMKLSLRMDASSVKQESMQRGTSL